MKPSLFRTKPDQTTAAEDFWPARQPGIESSERLQPARTALTESIDDERDWVRTWAIQAVEEQLDRKDALAQLRAVLPGVHRPDARSAVSEAITRLERRPAG